MIKFAAKYLPALMKFMAKSDIRYYLMGIYIEPHADGGAVLVATDGHRMLCVRDKEAEIKDAFLFKINGGVQAFCRKADAFVTINPETQRLTIEVPSEELFIQPGKCGIEGKFPDWRKVVPSFSALKPAVADFVKAKYIAECVMVHPLSATRHDAASVKLWQEKPESSIVIQYSDVPEFMGILMPVRMHSNGDSEGNLSRMAKSFGATLGAK